MQPCFSWLAVTQPYTHLCDLLRGAPAKAEHQECGKALGELGVRVSAPIDEAVRAQIGLHPYLGRKEEAAWKRQRGRGSGGGEVATHRSERG